ncbi:MAG: VWA domain-containing protein [Polyangiaceae bacterium]|nr:VWA domain-containing protein [Polyangiaceae bacterium]
MDRRREGGQRWWRMASGLLGALIAVSGCEADLLAEGDTLGSGGISGDGDVTVEVTVHSILSVLFPDLTEEELEQLAASLTIEAALELEAEIEGIRAAAEEFGRELFTTAEERVAEREEALADVNDGFPETLAPIAATAFQNGATGEAFIELAGVFSNRDAALLTSGDLTVTVDGEMTTHELACFHDGTPVDIVFLVDVTGSMAPVIGSVRRSLNAFVDAIVASNVTGTIGLVTFQDTVGVNVSFQEPSAGIERSPFFRPVALDDAEAIAELQHFISRLEADSGADAPENLGAALDFTNNGVIGYQANGEPNVIGDSVEDPPGTLPWRSLGNERRVFVAFTDSTFHSDSRTPGNSSLARGFKPRSIADIMASLHETGTVVHISDPSYQDKTTEPTGASSEVEVDADYWAIATGGVGEDRVLGYSLTDLELVVVAESTGLLDIALQSIVASSCRVTLPMVTLDASSTVSLELAKDGETSAHDLVPVIF